MKIGDGDNKNPPLIPPVEPAQGAGKPGDQRKSPEERVDDVRRIQDRTTFSGRITADDAIDLRGISQQDASTLADHAAFRGWEIANPYIGAMPEPLRELHETLKRVAAGEQQEATDPLRLESAGGAIAAALHVAGERPAGDLHYLTLLQSDAREIAAKIAAERVIKK